MGGSTPSASRRAVSRKPVWPIIRWSGRTARPSMCQLRIIVSQEVGSLKQPISRMDSTVRASCVVVAT
ncbi:hypothetical protein SALBM217S_02504 [Streptomyces griseoloalbus]